MSYDNNFHHFFLFIFSRFCHVLETHHLKRCLIVLPLLQSKPVLFNNFSFCVNLLSLL